MTTSTFSPLSPSYFQTPLQRIISPPPYYYFLFPLKKKLLLFLLFLLLLLVVLILLKLAEKQDSDGWEGITRMSYGHVPSYKNKYHKSRDLQRILSNIPVIKMCVKKKKVANGQLCIIRKVCRDIQHSLVKKSLPFHKNICLEKESNILGTMQIVVF